MKSGAGGGGGRDLITAGSGRGKQSPVSAALRIHPAWCRCPPTLLALLTFSPDLLPPYCSTYTPDLLSKRQLPPLYTQAAG